MASLNCSRADDNLGHLLAALLLGVLSSLTDADISLQLYSSRAARSGRPCVQINLEIFWKRARSLNRKPIINHVVVAAAAVACPNGFLFIGGGI